MTEITRHFLRDLCKHQSGCYITPHVNDRLYIHFKGIQKLQNLHEYTGLRVLWAESNAISKIENLNHQREMRTLYLQKNCIQKIENLEHMTHLSNLNLSENFISKVEHLSKLKHLQTLNLSNNNISTVDDLRHLVDCTSIEVLDLSQNRIQDPAVIEEVFFKMKQLKYLKLDGNPFIRQVKFYRKKLIINLPNLNYLDTMPVFADERRCALAWERGGLPEERLEREKIRQEEKDKHARSVQALDKMLDDHREEMRKKRELEHQQRQQRELEEKQRMEQERLVQQEEETQQVHGQVQEKPFNDLNFWAPNNDLDAFDFKIEKSDTADTQADVIGSAAPQGTDGSSPFVTEVDVSNTTTTENESITK